jgi:DNA-binding FrmR family transcriptional regulator
MDGMEARRRGIDDRQLDALLERLDGIRDELRSINRRLDSQDTLLRMTAEIAALNESLQALAYSALGQQAPQVRRRRRTG